ncbi:hypothetical protein TD95_000334 [Thielaviopsis punctulata]|uniref:BHLH domain-containing protein n=1 Tax=Thielaviopsis punctulata TaxID=72032 RepID=A0A0F4Z6B5_9PEZI|nr:hypothetical protein TD95_000334 [Thielaviopsis punctulata]
MAQPFTFGSNSNSIDPNMLASSFGQSYYHSQNDPFNSNTAIFDDDELLDGLQDANLPASTADYNSMNMAFSHPQTIFPNMDSQVTNFANPAEADPSRSPFMHSLGGRQSFQPIRTIQPIDDAASMIPNNNMSKMASNPRLSMGHKPVMSMSMGADPVVGSFGAQPIGVIMEQPNGNNKNTNAQPNVNPVNNNNNNNNNNGAATAAATWMQPAAGSFGQSFNSGLSSPPPIGRAQISEVMLKAGTSMPTKLNANQGHLSTQDLKRKRRRESHNLVERRRRDNINERIQDLSRLVPMHRLEDDKLRKLIQNGTPLSPTLTGLGASNSAAAGANGRRSNPGNITTGLPAEDKDKGPNKGDILNGAVSWMRDLLWMNMTLTRQREELENTIREMGGIVPFEFTDDEKRMHSEVLDIMGKAEMLNMSYSRTAGTGLRVPHHTDYKGEPLNGGTSSSAGAMETSPNGVAGLPVLSDSPLWDELNNGSGNNSLKEEDEYMEF